MVLKKILNLHEEATNFRLREVCEKYGAYVCPKMRLADIFPIENSGISHKLYKYALQAHFDFLVTDSEHQPLFAVEFDGPSHKSMAQIIRDEKKNTLCEKFELPLLRIKASYLIRKYRNLDLLTWFLEHWFVLEAFIKGQENNNMLLDEPFDSSLLSRLPGREERFPLWLSLGIPDKLYELYKSKKIKSWSPSHWIGVDEKENYFGLIWLPIDDEKGVIEQSAIQTQNFPVVGSEILTEILFFQLYEKLSRILEGAATAVSIQEIDGKIKTFTQKYEVRESMFSLPG